MTVPGVIAADVVWMLTAAAVGLAVVCVVGLAVCRRWGRQGAVMLRTGGGRRKIAFEGVLVIPGLHRLQRVDLTMRKIELPHRGEAAIPASDGQGVELRAVFMIRLQPEVGAVERALDRFGPDGLADETTLRGAFQPPLERAVREVIGAYSQADVYGLSHEDEILSAVTARAREALGADFLLDSAAIEYFPAAQN